MGNPRLSLLANLKYAWWSAVTPMVNSGFVPVPQPYHLTFVVTHPCNSRCIMCYLWHEKRGDELSVDEVRRIFRANDFSSLIALTLTGGEPTLRRDLPELLGTILRACPNIRQVTLATNGLDSQRIIKQIRACLKAIPANSAVQVFAVQVSVDGVGKVHDDIRGIPGYYERVMGTINLLKDMAKSEPRLTVKLSSTIQPGNLDSVPKLQAVAKELQQPIRFGALVFSPYYYMNNDQTQSLRFTPEQEKQAAVVFSQLADSDPSANVKFYYRDVARMVRGAPRGQTCMMGYYSFVLEFNGDVYACVNCEKRTFGNLRRQSFLEIWRGASANKVRQDVRTNCCPGCASICYVFPGNPQQVADIAFHRIIKYIRSKMTNIFGGKIKHHGEPRIDRQMTT